MKIIINVIEQNNKQKEINWLKYFKANDKYIYTVFILYP